MSHVARHLLFVRHFFTMHRVDFFLRLLGACLLGHVLLRLRLLRLAACIAAEELTGKRLARPPTAAPTYAFGSESKLWCS